MISLVLVGAAGRMGRAIAETTAVVPGFKVKACVDQALHVSELDGPEWGSDLSRFAAPGDVVVEFSTAAAAVQAAQVCAERGAALISGTTGLTEAEEEAMRTAGRRVAVLRSANFSMGVLALRRALNAAIPVLATWDVEIVERHHRGKQDSPSGTAMLLAHEVAMRRGIPAAALRHGRQGRLGPRPADEIGVHALRGGSWVGDHTVLLAGAGEWIELRHVAQDRSAFAHGVLAAAGFVAKASPGFYTFDAVLS